VQQIKENCRGEKMRSQEERKKLILRDSSFKKENCKTNKLEENYNKKSMKSNLEKTKSELIIKKKSLILLMS
jgi:hypothetical protein